jgi:hypothetical protein
MHTVGNRGILECREDELDGTPYTPMVGYTPITTSNSTSNLDPNCKSDDET